MEDKLKVVKKSNKELVDTIVELETINAKFLSGRKKLDEMLSAGKSYNDKSGHGYLPETAINLNNPKKTSIKVTRITPAQHNTQRSN